MMYNVCVSIMAIVLIIKLLLYVKSYVQEFVSRDIFHLRQNKCLISANTLNNMVKLFLFLGNRFFNNRNNCWWKIYILIRNCCFYTEYIFLYVSHISHKECDECSTYLQPDYTLNIIRERRIFSLFNHVVIFVNYWW